MIYDYEFYPFIDIQAGQSDFEIDNIVADLGLNRTQQCVLIDRVFNEIKVAVWPDDDSERPKEQIKSPYCELRVFYRDMFVAGVDLAMLIELGFSQRNICGDEEEIAALRTIQVVVETEIQKRLAANALP